MRRFAAILSLCVVLLAISIHPAWGQYYNNPPSKTKGNVQSLYFELFGNGIFFSLNYDIIFKNHFGTRAGAGFDFFPYLYTDPNNMNNSNDNNRQFKSWTLLLMENYYVGNGWLRLELGAGGVVGHLYSSDFTGTHKVKPPGLTFTTGLRFLPTKKNPISFKVAFTPFIAHGHFYPYVGVSIGWGVNTLF